MSTEPATGSTQSSLSARGRTVVVAGAASASGVAACRALEAAGAKVVAVGRDGARLDHALGGLADADLRTCDLSDSGAVDALARDLQKIYGGIDGLIHLVGGWRGGGGITGQTDADWDFLETNILRTLRNASRSFYDQLAASDDGRLAIVSSTAVEAPTAGGAAYAAAKAGAEAWVQAVAQGLRRAQSGAKENPVPQHSAAVVLVVKALVDDSMRAAEPERSFSSYTDVQAVADAVVDLFSEDAAQLNGRRISLVPGA